HNVLGFYVVIIALILALTGMVYSFTWFNAAVYAAGSLSVTPPAMKMYQSTASLENDTHPLDKAFLTAIEKNPDAKRYMVSLPAAAQSPLIIRAYHRKEVYFDANTLYFDQYSGEPLGTQLYKDMNNGEKLIMMNYDLHVGSIGGLPGKIIAFLVSLVCASLPVTGFIIWLGKKKKKAKPVNSIRSVKRVVTI
ncbi:MAG: PepSY domain-containing protein, partial [Chitinophagaceae bacterium]